MRYRVRCDLSYDVKEPTVFVFNVEVAALRRHDGLRERLTITPDRPRRCHTVPGLKNRYVSVTAAPGPLQVVYEAELELDVLRAAPTMIEETPRAEIPLAHLPFLLPSRYVPSDRLADFARREFGEIAPGYNRVVAICNWIYENIEYRRGSSNEQTTADESLLLRAGVCRDFAHLGIAFCRALNIPARFVSCYADGLEPADFHAVFEAYLDRRWWLFDATRQAHLDGLVRIGVGRDAAETAFSSPFGAFEPGPIRILMERIDGAPQAPARTTDAIATDDPASEPM